MNKHYSNGTRNYVGGPLFATGTDVCADLRTGYLPIQQGFLDAPLAIPGGSAIRIDPDDSDPQPATVQSLVLRP